ncbi:DDE-type integrase/transposase/recombinase [Saccharothrix syringae]|uniref:Integrase catalytic domain-containing protein n=1 Tax=Saccharothrix syringae TaxID=103733 RepID=A0A5Q0GYG8_SACSY|nr:DDE-type integrase/transposase/recombinase [Saccharothrix syringae]QFZ18550.1 hypothetical protein EKG83_14725 [Saccharothrix syringae]
MTDATRIRTGEGAFWLAAVRDAFSNRIVGWKTSDRCDTDLVLGALEYAIWSRDVRDGQLIHHSGRGSTYTAFRFTERLQDNGILPSMGSGGDSYDCETGSRYQAACLLLMTDPAGWLSLLLICRPPGGAPPSGAGRTGSDLIAPLYVKWWCPWRLVDL